ncbi:hypothetical protein F4677DRAFT_406390 [Hypoxylon crocopeplum]|nr:hypothetical protein F4677DRAFT_406390 [Hypoxylon crocopeplum]
MAPQTRSHGKSSASVSYKSTTAAPKQKLFPARQRHIKTYGRARTTRKDPKQGTLTQMNFVPSSMPEDPLNSEGEEEDAVEELEAPARVVTVKPKKRGRGSRRKTTGDDLTVDEKPRASKRRKTLGDAPNSNPSSSFHTQTLTQLLSTKGDDDYDVWQISDSADEDNADFIIETPKKAKNHAPASKPMPNQQAEVISSVPSLIKSVTPTNRRTKTVIPSSTSPLTPMLTRYSPAPYNSPLGSKSTNIGAPSPIIKKLHKTPKDRVIPDSYGTYHGSPSTPTPKVNANVTPSKKLRFRLPENKENITPGRSSPKYSKPLKEKPARLPLQLIREVPDSDGDDFDEIEDELAEEAVEEGHDALMDPDEENIPPMDDPEAAETCYGAIGDETQAELISSMDELTRELSESESLESSRSRASTPTPKQRKREARRTIHVTSTSAPLSSIVEQTPSTPPQKGPSDEDISKAQTQIYTQGLESQRLPLEAIRALGPQTYHSDMMVSLHPEPLARILNRTKNHEFRSWEIPPGVSRVWLYTTRPHSELKYMCILSPPKVPGEIEDEKGIGNVEFNQGGKAAKFAYEIVQVYELNDPVSLEEMKQKGWLKSAPQKFIWVPPAVVGELTANLKCALFEEEQEAEAALVATSPNVTESQELRAQLQTDVGVVPSSQSSRRATAKRNGDIRSFAKPAVPRLHSGSSVQSVSAPLSQRGHGFVRPSQATTVSSPTVSPEKSLPHAIAVSSDPSAHHLHSSSPTAFRSARTHSLRSSQFPTRSQILPNSLIDDDIQEPPPIILDSADEQSD